MERSEDDQIAFTWRQFYSEDQDIPEQLNFFAMVKVSLRFSDIHWWYLFLDLSTAKLYLQEKNQMIENRVQMSV